MINQRFSILAATISLAVFSIFCFHVNAAHAQLQPKTLIVPMIPGNVPNRFVPGYGATGPVRDYNVVALQNMVNNLRSRGYNVDVYGGKFDASGNLTSVPTMPFYENTQRAYDFAKNAIQGSSAERVWLYGGEHGSTNGGVGISDAFGDRNQFLGLVNSIPVESGQKITINDNSCGSGNCGYSGNLFTSNGPVDSLVASSRPGQLTDTGVLTNNIYKTQDSNGDEAISVDELSASRLSGDQRMTTLKKPGESDPQLFFKKDYKQETIVVDSKYRWVNGEFVADVKTVPESETVKNISDEKQKELALNRDRDGINGVALGSVSLVGPNPYRVGKECQKNHFAGPGNAQSGVTLSQFTESSFKPCDYDEQFRNTQNTNNLNPSNPFGGDGQGQGGALGGAGGLNSILPLLMQGLLGGGGQGGQNPYGNQYSQQQQQNCASIPQSPVCGTDGKTYNNACYLRQAGIAIQKQGVCVQATSTPSPAVTPNVAVVLNQVGISGIPSSIIESVKSIVASIIATTPTGVTVIK